MPSKVILRIAGLRKSFLLSGGIFSFLTKQRAVHAVDGVDLEVQNGEILVLAGESGCGKTTLGRLIVKLANSTEGSITFETQDISSLKDGELKNYRRKSQMIFQNPYDSLNERRTVFDTIREPLLFHHLATSKQHEIEMVREVLELVRLPPDYFISRYIGQLSGGERQRVGIARAMIMKPNLIIADEPVSMLDVSIRAEILNILTELREKFGLTIIMITHDLALARYFADRIAIMYLGKIVECGPANRVCASPAHPYTKALIDAVPRPDPLVSRRKATVWGEPATAINPPTGCRFHPRCALAKPQCIVTEPVMVKVEDDHSAACILYDS